MATQPEAAATPEFSLDLDNFSGPLDLLLSLITRRRLDITEIALAEVTDEFLAYMRRFPDLSRTTEFLVIATTLLDIKASRLLPSVQVDEDDVDYLEARDLLFARLLQYRAFKEAAGELASLASLEERYVPRSVPLDPALASLVPELTITHTPDQLARLAALVLSQRPPRVAVTHLHDPLVAPKTQIPLLVAKLEEAGRVSFLELVADTDKRTVVVARFLALLDLYREGRITFEQSDALGPLIVSLSESKEAPC